MELEVRIERPGAQGDGVAQGPDGPLYVPFTIPGERVRIAAEPGQNRAEPLDPSTCARDLRVLVDGGYRITRIVPVDQFLFSPHIELMAQLER